MPLRVLLRSDPLLPLSPDLCLCPLESVLNYLRAIASRHTVMHSRSTSPLERCPPSAPQSLEQASTWKLASLGILAAFVKGMKLLPNRSKKGVGEEQGDGVVVLCTFLTPDHLNVEEAAPGSPPSTATCGRPQPHPGPSPLPHLVSCSPRDPPCFPAPACPQGIRMLDQPFMTDIIGVSSISHMPQLIDIYSAQLGAPPITEDAWMGPGSSRFKRWREQGKVTPVSSWEWGRMGPGWDEVWGGE